MYSKTQPDIKGIYVINLETVHGVLETELEEILCEELSNRKESIKALSKERSNLHNWIVADILNIGNRLGFQAMPEYKISLPGFTSTGRPCKGQIDAVWLKENIPLYGFEVGFSHGKPRELAKLQLIPCGVLVQLNRTGLKQLNIKKANRYFNANIPLTLNNIVC